MANAITITTILDGVRNLIKKIDIVGDGSGEETDTLIVDVSAHGCTAVSILKEYHQISGFSANLEWDASTDTVAFATIEGEGGIDFNLLGGPLNNNSGSGKTGDIMMSTSGLSSGDTGSIILVMRKK
jgi:hypothetical protein